MITSAQENSYEYETKKVLIALALAKTPAPLGYIAFYTGIKELLPLVLRLEEKGWIRRCPSSSWSCSQSPLFELLPEIQKELWAYL